MYIYGCLAGNKKDSFILFYNLYKNNFDDIKRFFNLYHDLVRNSKDEYLDLLIEIYNNDYMEFCDEYSCFLQELLKINDTIIHIHHGDVYIGLLSRRTLNQKEDIDENKVNLILKYFGIKSNYQKYYVDDY